MNMLLAFGMPGLPEMLIIGGIFILFFGSTKLPGLARSIGKSANEFKKGIREMMLAIATQTATATNRLRPTRSPS
jgi:TatA/E family protein of Tat protein translocase